MMMPLPKQMQMRPIRHRRRRAHPHHHHPPTHARLVSSVPSSHARRLSVDRPPNTRASVVIFIHSFIHSPRAVGRRVRPTAMGVPTRGCSGCPVCVRPTAPRSSPRASGRSDDRSIARLGGRSDASCLIVTSHYSSLRPTHDAATPRRHPRDESSEDPEAMGRIGIHPIGSACTRDARVDRDVDATCATRRVIRRETTERRCERRNRSNREND